MTIKVHYEKRKEDVEEFFRFLCFLLSFETHHGRFIQNVETGDILIITQEMQCVAKAQSLILLYNLVESTVCDCLNEIYDAIRDDNLNYGNVSNDIKKMWRNYLNRKDLPEKLKSDNEIINMPINFESLAINISGSLDFRKIQDVFSKHGCLLDNSSRETIANSFLVVKNKRNLLAHGNISFSDCGAHYILSELLSYKEHIVDYMQDVVKKTYDYINNRTYKLSVEKINNEK